MKRTIGLVVGVWATQGLGCSDKTSPIDELVNPSFTTPQPSSEIPVDAEPSGASAPPDASSATPSSPAEPATPNPGVDVSSQGVKPTSASNGWTLVWSDEFDAGEIDPERWSRVVDCTGGGNGESQCYTNEPANAFVADGQLHLVAIEQTYSGPAVNPDDPNYDANDQSTTLPFTSARLRSRDLGDFKYGRFEFRAKLPFGQGSWPALWMLPTDEVYGGWAASGEIDVLESVNLRVGGEDRVYGTLHYGAGWPANVQSGMQAQLPAGANPSDDFHVYAIEWEAGEIRWYLDDQHYATQRASGWYAVTAADGSVAPAPAPFDQPFHLLMNLAVGGAWAGNVNDTGVDTSIFPQELLIDWVRVFQCAADPATGDGCDTVGPSFGLVAGNLPPG